MRKHIWLLVLFIGLTVGMTHLISEGAAMAASGAEIEYKVNAAVKDLAAKYPCTAELAWAFTTTTTKADIYAFFFDQKGLMAGMGLQGTKITKIDK